MSAPSGWAMERAAEEIGPDILLRLNQKQLAKQIDRALAPLVRALVEELRKIDADERFHYDCANVFVNAPLALVQLEMETRAAQAQRLLKLVEYDGPEMHVRSGPLHPAAKRKRGPA